MTRLWPSTSHTVSTDIHHDQTLTINYSHTVSTDIHHDQTLTINYSQSHSQHRHTPWPDFDHQLQSVTQSAQTYTMAPWSYFDHQLVIQSAQTYTMAPWSYFDHQLVIQSAHTYTMTRLWPSTTVSHTVSTDIHHGSMIILWPSTSHSVSTDIPHDHTLTINYVTQSTYICIMIIIIQRSELMLDFSTN